MSELFLNVIPILFLIAFGYVLRRIQYFSDAVVQKLTSFVGELLVPCVIFTTILNLDIRKEHIALSAAFFCFLLLLMGLSWLVYKLLKIQRRFFIFFSCAFAFGLMGIPLFSTVFGAENMAYLVAMGVGHELFFAIVYVTCAKVVLQKEKFSGKTLLKNLTSPLFCMVVAALILKFTGLKSVVEATVIGNCLLQTIAKIASITTVMTMIIVGYRIHFVDKKRLGESVLYVVFRYALAFGVGYLMKALVFDKLVAPSPYFDYAFFTMLSQFGSTMLVVLVGEHCSREDVEVSSNAFVINVIVGIVLYVIYVGSLGIGA